MMKQARLENLKIGDVVRWQERKTEVLGSKRCGRHVTLQLRILELHHAAREEALEKGLSTKQARDVSFWTQPIAPCLTVERMDR